MNNGVNVLHHLGIISHDMEAAVKQYERLGFVFTPLSLPRIPLQTGANPEPIGAGNRCAIFRNNYLEMLGIVDQVRWASTSPEQRGPFDLDEPLRRYEGLHVLHLGADDLDPVRRRLLESGLHPSAIRAFQRLVDTPEGPRMMRARALSFPHGSNPEALLQIAQHETPELVLQPRYMQHPNGATSITEVLVCVEDPASIAQKYAYYAARPVYKNGVVFLIELGLSRIMVVSPNHLSDILPGHVARVIPFLAGLTLSSDLEVTKHALKARRIDFEVFGGRILVNAKDGCGAAVLFEDSKSDPRKMLPTFSRISA
jgi:hypothetical protein